MSSIRQLRTGKWEVTVRHPQLPKGRKFFTFGDEGSARAYGKQWDMLVEAGLPPPASLLVQPPGPVGTLGVVIRARANGNNVARSEQPTLDLLLREVGAVKLTSLDYAWAAAWVERLKLERRLAPGSIRKRVGALSRALDDYLRSVPGVTFTNPLKTLPKRYSVYSDREAGLLRAVGHDLVPDDKTRDRRLTSSEVSAIVDALSGAKRVDRERPLRLMHGDAMRVLFLLIVHTGLRLKEAYTLRVDQVDLARKVIRAQKSKLWHGKVAFKDVPIQPALYTDLANFIEGKTGLVFPFWDGEEPVRKVTNRLSSAFSTAFKYAGCEDLTEHDLRHEATCRWLELKDGAGGWVFRLEEVNRIMGWAPNSAMAHRYASFRGEGLAAKLWA